MFANRGHQVKYDDVLWFAANGDLEYVIKYGLSPDALLNLAIPFETHTGNLLRECCWSRNVALLGYLLNRAVVMHGDTFRIMQQTLASQGNLKLLKYLYLACTNIYHTSFSVRLKNKKCVEPMLSIDLIISNAARAGQIKILKWVHTKIIRGNAPEEVSVTDSWFPAYHSALVMDNVKVVEYLLTIDNQIKIRSAWKIDTLLKMCCERQSHKAFRVLMNTFDLDYSVPQRENFLLWSELGTNVWGNCNARKAELQKYIKELGEPTC
jgi:hypothetical protein